MAKEARDDSARGNKLGLTDEELAFYDALATNNSAVEIMGDASLAFIAKALLTTVRQNTTIDWNVRESAKAHMRRMVKRILRQYGYPPDLEDAAVQFILKQAEAISSEL